MKAVIIYSGGMDSFTLLHDLRSKGIEVHPISFNYGQRHRLAELSCAASVCKRLELPHHIVDLSSVKALLKGSALTDDIPVPLGHYAEESMKLTVAPNRNMIMLSIAIAHGVAIEADAVYYGAHAGDHAIYPDCRPEFVQAMDYAAKLGNYHRVFVHAPYLQMTKGDILKRGLTIGLTPEDYFHTWTCYQGGPLACGECGACTERLEAFTFAGAIDPIRYA